MVKKYIELFCQKNRVIEYSKFIFPFFFCLTQPDFHCSTILNNRLIKELNEQCCHVY